MKSTEPSRLTSGVGTDRRIPTWAAGLISGLSRDLPTVLTREEIDRLCSLDIHYRHIDETFRKLGLES